MVRRILLKYLIGKLFWIIKNIINVYKYGKILLFICDKCLYSDRLTSTTVYYR